MEITFVLPAYNEEGNIEKCIDGIVNMFRNRKEHIEILVINDGSIDNTCALATRASENNGELVKVINHEQNRGLGKALETGFKNSKGKYIITMDADGSHEVSYIDNILEGLNSGNDIVIASRYIKDGGMSGVEGYRVLLSKIGNIVIRKISGNRVLDKTSGYRGYNRESTIDILNDLPRGFEVQMEIIKRAMGNRLNIAEIPFTLKHRQAGKSKMCYRELVIPYIRIIRELNKIA
jgi:dolichol-phosphate mannosyltransferase